MKPSDQAPRGGRSKQVMISAGVLVVIGLMIAGVIAVNQTSQQTADTTEPTSSATSSRDSDTSGADTDAAATGTYTAGTYQARGSYTSPGGTTAIDLSLTIDAAGQVTASNASSATDNPTSRQYQAKFISGYKEQVIGKNISQLKLSKVSGSSLTPKGFNDALSDITNQARS